MPLRKVHELTFLWFGLPGPLLSEATEKVRISALSPVAAALVAKCGESELPILCY